PEDQAKQSEKELVQVETISGPFALLILLAVFASIVAAGLPLLVAALTIPTTLGGVYLAAQVTELSIYVQNVATMLGLALAIDYSLFMVSRFREELRRGRSVGEAVEITVATSGKAVTFSGLAVAIGLSGLLLFRPTALRSFGIGGSLVVAASVFYALTFLPAILGMVDGDPTSPANIAKLTAYAEGVAAVGGIDRIEGPFSNLKNPQTGAPMSAAEIAAFYAAPANQLPPALSAARDQLREAYVRGPSVRLHAISPLDPVSPARGAVVPAVRAIHVDGVTAEVGGLAAEGHDFMTSQAGTIPYAVGVTLIASAVILFLLFGSVVIP